MAKPVPLPDARDTLLVRAALLPAPEAAAAWREWCATGGDIEAAPRAFPVLPLVYRNLRDQPDVPELARLHGIYRRTWYRNRLMLARLQQTLAELSGAGIDTLLLKGGALVVGYGAEAGAWHMSDFDVLVHPADLGRGAGLLMDQGWRRLFYGGNLDVEVRYARAVALIDPDGALSVDLHGYMHGQERGIDNGLWRRARPVAFGDGSVRVPAPEDLLINVLAHAFRWLNGPTLRWTADVHHLVTQHPDLDWDLVVREARRRFVANDLARGLHYLIRTVSLPVPPEALAALAVPQKLPLDYRLAAATTSWPGYAGHRWATFVVTFVHVTHDQSLPRRLLAVPGFLAYAWRLDSGSDVPRVALRKTATTLAAAIGMRPRRPYAPRTPTERA